MPVVTLSGLDLMIEAGADVEIEAKKDATSQGPNWMGEWYIYGIEPETSEKFILVQGQSLDPKQIKTTNSVIYHCKRLGYRVAILPLWKGDKITLTKEHRK